MRLDLSADDSAALTQHTEGWIAGLQLAALSLQSSADVSGFIAAFTGSQRYIVDYLIEEVLECQPESTQSFLLLASILERMTGSVCDALTGRADGQLMLQKLDRRTSSSPRSTTNGAGIAIISSSPMCCVAGCGRLTPSVFRNSIAAPPGGTSVMELCPKRLATHWLVGIKITSHASSSRTPCPC